jgi:hypothetical protein
MEATGVMGALGGLKELLARTGIHEKVEPGESRTTIPAARTPADISGQRAQSALSALAGITAIAPPQDEER